MIGINTVAVIKNSEQSFKIFDAHSRDLHGMPHSFGKCTLLTTEGIENLPFEIKGVFVRDIMNLICKMFTRVQKLNNCLSEIKEPNTTHEKEAKVFN